MVRTRLVLTVVGVLCAAMAQAQTKPINGLVTGHIGIAHGGDIENKGVTPGGSVAIIESTGIGAEIDVAHVRRFNSDVFSESGITTLMINALAMRQRGIVRPFGEGGVGLLRIRATPLDLQPIISRTDWGFNAGGGAMVMLNDFVGIRGDLRYFRLFQRQDDIPLTDSGSFDFWRTSVGVTWSWPIR